MKIFCAPKPRFLSLVHGCFRVKLDEQKDHNDEEIVSRKYGTAKDAGMEKDAEYVDALSLCSPRFSIRIGVGVMAKLHSQRAVPLYRNRRAEILSNCS